MIASKPDTGRFRRHKIIPLGRRRDAPPARGRSSAAQHLLAREGGHNARRRLIRSDDVEVALCVLENRLLTAEEVLEAVREPRPAELLEAIARHPRFLTDPRIRLALACNEATPDDIRDGLLCQLDRAGLMEASAMTRSEAVRRKVTLLLEHRSDSQDEAPEADRPS